LRPSGGHADGGGNGVRSVSSMIEAGAGDDRRQRTSDGHPAFGFGGVDPATPRGTRVPRPKRQLTLHALQDASRGSWVRDGSLRLCSSAGESGLRGSVSLRAQACGSEPEHERPRWGQWAEGAGEPAVVRPPATIRDASGVRVGRGMAAEKRRSGEAEIGWNWMNPLPLELPRRSGRAFQRRRLKINPP